MEVIYFPDDPRPAWLVHPVLGLGNFPELVPADWLTAHPAMQGRGGKAPSVVFLLNQGGGA